MEDQINNSQDNDQASALDNNVDFNNLEENSNMPQNTPNNKELNDDFDINQEFDFSNIDKIQKQISLNMGSEFQEIAQDDNEDDENSVVKKYLVYISKDFVPILDDLSANELSAYVNDAIQKKIDMEDEEKSKTAKRKALTHLFVSIITAIIACPFLLIGAYKSIIVTLDNYKHSQSGFEKLYQEKFNKNTVHMRAVRFNQKKYNASEAKNKH